MVFGKYDLKKELQDTLVDSVLNTGSLMSIEKSKDISVNLRDILLKEIEANKTYSAYVKANFVPYPLEE